MYWLKSRESILVSQLLVEHFKQHSHRSPQQRDRTYTEHTGKLRSEQAPAHPAMLGNTKCQSGVTTTSVTTWLAQEPSFNLVKLT